MIAAIKATVDDLRAIAAYAMLRAAMKLHPGLLGEFVGMTAAAVIKKGKKK